MTGSRLTGTRVLVVDDAPYVLDVVTEILQTYGAQVTAVERAEDALEILQRERPDVLVSDLAMPGRGGYWLIGQVRALSPERGGATPAAALTAYSSDDHLAGVLRAGFQVHVEKPAGVQQLVAVIAALAATKARRGVDAASSTR